MASAVPGKGDRSEIRKRWALLAAVMVCLFFVHGAPTHALPFVFGPISREMDWTREQVTALASLKFLTGALVALVFGAIMDRIGDRLALLIAIVINAVAVMSFLLVDSLLSYYLVGAALGVSGPATLTGMKTFLTRRFNEQPGAAVGIAVAGTSVAGAVIPLVIVALLAMFNWRVAMALMTIGTWLLALPLFWWITRGEQQEKARPPATASAARAGPSAWSLFREMARTRDFWLIAIGLFLVGAVDQGMLQHQVLFLRQDVGMSAVAVAGLTSAFALIGVFAKILFGTIYDRFSIKGIAFAYLLLLLNPVLALTLVGPLTAGLFILARGAAHGALIVDIPILAKHVFGQRNLGFVIGVFSCVFQLGFAFGPWFLGRLQTMSGSYVSGFLAFAGFALVAALLVAQVQPRYWRRGARSRLEDRPAAAEIPA